MEGKKYKRYTGRTLKNKENKGKKWDEGWKKNNKMNYHDRSTPSQWHLPKPKRLSTFSGIQRNHIKSN